MMPAADPSGITRYGAAVPTLGGGLEDDGEDIEILELTVDGALTMVGDGRIVDGTTIMLLQWLALNRSS